MEGQATDLAKKIFVTQLMKNDYPEYIYNSYKLIRK